VAQRGLGAVLPLYRRLRPGYLINSLPLAGGALAAMLIWLPLVVFAGVAMVGALTLVNSVVARSRRFRPSSQTMRPWTKS
jgi:hypothetical protein